MKKIFSFLFAFLLTLGLSFYGEIKVKEKISYDNTSFILNNTNEEEAKSLADELGCDVSLSVSNDFATFTNVKNVDEVLDSHSYLKERVSYEYETKFAGEEITPSDIDANAIKLINASSASTKALELNGKLAIIDSGVNLDNPIFNYGSNQKFIDENSINISTGQTVRDYGYDVIRDEVNHGDVVASIALRNMNKNRSNYNPLIIKVEPDHISHELKTSEVIAAIDYAIENGASIINLSLATIGAEDPYTKVIDKAVANDVLVVASSGNQGYNTKVYPASNKDVIGVGGLDFNYELSSDSNYGENVDVVASDLAVVDGRVYKGTSFAAPQVTWALLHNVKFDNGNNSYYTRNITRDDLFDTCNRFWGKNTKDYYCGYGLLDVDKLCYGMTSTITYDFGTVEIENTTVNVHNDCYISNPIIPERLYHQFGGWYLDPFFDKKVDFNTFKPTTNLTLYAKWVYQEEDKFPFTYEIIKNTNVRITGYKGVTKDIIIPQTIHGYPVTEIGSKAFSSLKLRSVKLPKTLLSIGDFAFYNNSLEEVDLPTNITFIGKSAFDSNRYLTNVQFNDNNKLFIGLKAFANTAVTNVKFPNIEYYNNSFDDCSKLESISFGPLVSDLQYADIHSLLKLNTMNIDNRNPYFKCENKLLMSYPKDVVFSSFNNVENVVIPNETKTIYDKAFYRTNLKTIDLNNVSVIGEFAFSGTQLESVNIPGSVTYTGYYAFSHNNRLKEITFMEGFETANVTSYAENPNLEKINFPSTLKYIEGKAFFNDVKLKNLDLSKTNLIAIKDEYRAQNSMVVVEKTSLFDRGAFEDCNIETLLLPDTIEKIGIGAFRNCNLTTFKPNENSNLKQISKEAFDNNKIKDVYLSMNIDFPKNYRFGMAFINNPIVDIKVSPKNAHLKVEYSYCNDLSLKSSDGKVLHYYHRLDENCGTTPNAFEGVETITSNAIIGSIRNFIIDDKTSINKIESYAFYGANVYELKLLKEINIYPYAFSCMTIDALTIENISMISEGAFAYSNISYFYNFDDKLEEIGASAFEQVISKYGLQTITLPKNLRIIGDYAFAGSSLSFNFNDKIEYIGIRAFSGTQITEFIAPSSVTNINFEAFLGCKRLTKVKLNDGLKELNGSVFGECYITDFTMGQGIETINSYGLEGIAIPSLVIPATVKNLYECSLYTDYIKTITFSNNSLVEKLDKEVFRSYSLHEINFGKNSNLSKIENKCFDFLPNLEVLDLSGTKITDISAYAFSFMGNLRDLKLPNGIQTIGKYAFYGCKSLRTLYFGSSLKFIGAYAFLHTKDLSCYFKSESSSTVNFDGNWNFGLNNYKFGVLDVLTDGDFELAKLDNTNNEYLLMRYLGSDTFLDLRNLKYTISSIMSEAFTNTPVKEIILSDSITSIYKNAFYNSNLERITLNAKLKVIGNGAFRNAKLKEVIIPSNSELEVIDVEAFAGNKNLTNFTFPSSLRKINEGAFFDVDLQTIDFSKATNLVYIGDLAFAYNKNLKSLTLPQNLATLGNFAFRDNSLLESVVFGTSELSLGEGAFYNSGLINIEIPSNVVKIGETCFTGLPNLVNIEVSKDNLYYASKDGILYNKKLTIIYVVPATKTGKFTIDSSIEVIGTSAFENSKLSSIKVAPNSQLEVISNRAFFGSSFKEFYVPYTISIIDYYAFAYNKELETVTFDPDCNIVNIREGAFYYCSKLKNMILPKTIKKVGSYCFYGCKNLSDSIFANGIPEVIDDYAFAYTNLKNLHIEEGTYGSYAFAYLNLNKLYINDKNIIYKNDLIVNSTISDLTIIGDINIQTFLNSNEILDKVTIKDNENYFTKNDNIIYQHRVEYDYKYDIFYIPSNVDTIIILENDGLRKDPMFRGIKNLYVSLDTFDYINTFERGVSNVYINNTFQEYLDKGVELPYWSHYYFLDEHGNYSLPVDLYINSNTNVNLLKNLTYERIYFDGNADQLVNYFQKLEDLYFKTVYYKNDKNQYIKTDSLTINLTSNDVIPNFKFNKLIYTIPNDSTASYYVGGYYNHLVIKGGKNAIVSFEDIESFEGSANNLSETNSFDSIKYCYLTDGTLKTYMNIENLYLSGNVIIDDGTTYNIKNIYLTKDLTNFEFTSSDDDYGISDLCLYDEADLFFTLKLYDTKKYNWNNTMPKIKLYVLDNGKYVLPTTINIGANKDVYLDNINLLNNDFSPITMNLDKNVKSINFGNPYSYFTKLNINYLGTIDSYINVKKIGDYTRLNNLTINNKKPHVDSLIFNCEYFDFIDIIGLKVDSLIFEEGFVGFKNATIIPDELELKHLSLPKSFVMTKDFSINVDVLEVKGNIETNNVTCKKLIVSDVPSLHTLNAHFSSLVIRDTVLEICDGLLYDHKNIKYLEIPYMGRTNNETNENHVNLAHLFAPKAQTNSPVVFSNSGTNCPFIEVKNGNIINHDPIVFPYKQLTLVYNGAILRDNDLNGFRFNELIISDALQDASKDSLNNTFTSYLEIPYVYDILFSNYYIENLTITKQNRFERTFASCEINELSLLASNLYFGSHAFENATIGRLVVNDTLIELGEYALHNCYINPTKPLTFKLSGEYAINNSHDISPITIIGNIPNNNTFLEEDVIELIDCNKFNIGELPYSATLYFNKTVNEFLRINTSSSVKCHNLYFKDANGNYVSLDSIERIELNNGENVPSDFFYNCTNLKEVIIGENVSKIEKYFIDKQPLVKCNLYFNNSKISTNVISNIKFDTIEIGPNVKTVNNVRCKDLILDSDKVEFPDGLGGVEYFGSLSLNGNNLTDYYYIPKYLDELTLEGEFTNEIFGTQITRLNLKESFNISCPRDYLLIADSIYYDGDLGSLTFAYILKSIHSNYKQKLYVLKNGAYELFDGTITINSETIPEHCYYLYESLYSLKKIILSEGVKNVGSWAFKNLVLDEIHLPSTLVYSSDLRYAFTDTKIKKIYNNSNLNFTIKGNSGSDMILIDGEFLYDKNGLLVESFEHNTIRVGDFEFSIINGNYILTNYYGNSNKIILPKDVEGHTYTIDYVNYYITELELNYVFDAELLKRSFPNLTSIIINEHSHSFTIPFIDSVETYYFNMSASDLVSFGKNGELIKNCFVKENGNYVNVNDIKELHITGMIKDSVLLFKNIESIYITDNVGLYYDYSYLFNEYKNIYITGDLKTFASNQLKTNNYNAIIYKNIYVLDGQNYIRPNTIYMYPNCYAFIDPQAQNINFVGSQQEFEEERKYEYEYPYNFYYLDNGNYKLLESLTIDNFNTTIRNIKTLKNIKVINSILNIDNIDNASIELINSTLEYYGSGIMLDKLKMDVSSKLNGYNLNYKTLEIPASFKERYSGEYIYGHTDNLIINYDGTSQIDVYYNSNDVYFKGFSEIYINYYYDINIKNLHFDNKLKTIYFVYKINPNNYYPNFDIPKCQIYYDGLDSDLININGISIFKDNPFYINGELRSDINKKLNSSIIVNVNDNFKNNVLITEGIKEIFINNQLNENINLVTDLNSIINYKGSVDDFINFVNIEEGSVYLNYFDNGTYKPFDRIILTNENINSVNKYTRIIFKEIDSGSLTSLNLSCVNKLLFEKLILNETLNTFHIDSGLSLETSVLEMKNKNIEIIYESGHVIIGTIIGRGDLNYFAFNIDFDEIYVTNDKVINYSKYSTYYIPNYVKYVEVNSFATLIFDLTMDEVINNVQIIGELGSDTVFKGGILENPVFNNTDQFNSFGNFIEIKQATINDATNLKFYYYHDYDYDYDSLTTLTIKGGKNINIESINMLLKDIYVYPNVDGKIKIDGTIHYVGTFADYCNSDLNIIIDKEFKTYVFYLNSDNTYSELSPNLVIDDNFKKFSFDKLNGYPIISLEITTKNITNLDFNDKMSFETLTLCGQNVTIKDNLDLDTLILKDKYPTIDINKIYVTNLISYVKDDFANSTLFGIDYLHYLEIETTSRLQFAQKIVIRNQQGELELYNNYYVHILNGNNISFKYGVNNSDINVLILDKNCNLSNLSNTNPDDCKVRFVFDYADNKWPNGVHHFNLNNFLNPKEDIILQDNLLYVKENGVFYLEGKYDYRYSKSDLKLPDYINGETYNIRSKAFYRAFLSSVYFGEGIKRIEANAFDLYDTVKVTYSDKLKLDYVGRNVLGNHKINSLYNGDLDAYILGNCILEHGNEKVYLYDTDRYKDYIFAESFETYYTNSGLNYFEGELNENTINYVDNAKTAYITNVVYGSYLNSVRFRNKNIAFAQDIIDYRFLIDSYNCNLYFKLDLSKIELKAWDRFGRNKVYQDFNIMYFRNQNGSIYDASILKIGEIVKIPVMQEIIDKKYNYEFLGYDFDGDMIADVVPATINKATECRALFKKTIKTFSIKYTYNGKVIYEDIVDYGSDYTAKDSLNIKGYDFVEYLSNINFYDVTQDEEIKVNLKHQGEHKFSEQFTVQPTCDKEGYVYEKCPICGETRIIKYIEKLPHEYETTVVKPTCNEEGYTIHTCKHCGETYKDNIVPALKHDIKEWKVIKEPTCEEEGLKEGTCSRCGRVFKEVIPALEHNLIFVERVESTCSKEGYILYRCDKCNQEFKVILDVLPHKFVKVKVSREVFDKIIAVYPNARVAGDYTLYMCKDCMKVETYGNGYNEGTYLQGNEGLTDWIITIKPTCISEGVAERRGLNSGEVMDIKILPKVPHSIVHVDGKAPTCTEDGYSAYDYCENCGEKFGYEIIPSLGHNFGEWELVTSPTKNEEGLIKRVCKNDPTHIEYFHLPVLTSKEYEIGNVIKKPTCTTEGVGELIYTIDNQRFVFNEYLPLVDHKYEVIKIVNPTCEEAGYRIIKCSECGHEIRETIPSLGHDYGEPTYSFDINNKTVTATVICKNDPTHKIVETVAIIEDKIVAPTCTEDGYIEYLPEGFNNPLFDDLVKHKVIIPAIGHNYGEFTLYQDTNEFGMIIVKRVCKNDPTHIETFEFNIYSGNLEIIEQPNCSHEGKGRVTYNSSDINFTVMVTLPKNDSHEYNNPTYSFDIENKTITATAVCKHNPNHIITETKSIYPIREKTPTFTQSGYIIYISKDFINDIFSVQSKEIYIDPLNVNHYIEYVWNYEKGTVTANLISKSSNLIVDTEEVEFTKTIIKEATSKEEGEVLYQSNYFYKFDLGIVNKTETIPMKESNNLLGIGLGSAIGVLVLTGGVILFIKKRKKM